MASARNNRAQDRRAALRERQRREKEAADAVFSLLDKEDKAREASAGGVANLADVVGKARAADLLGLTPAEVTAYLTLHRKVTGTDEDAGASIPGQSEPGATAAAPATA